MPAVELLQSLGRPGGVRALLVHGSNLVVSSPNVEAVREGIAALDLLVVCDFFLSETAALADVVLPDHPVGRGGGHDDLARGPGHPPPPRDHAARRACATSCGSSPSSPAGSSAPRRFDTDPELVFEELRLASEGGIADYSGIDYAMLDRGEAAYWPYPRGSAGTPRLFADRFAHPDGLARLVAVSVRETARPRPAEGELTLITGRLLEHYQSGAQTRRVPELAEAQPEALASMHPATAERLGIADGDDLELANARGTVRCRARLTPDIRPDAVFLPFHYGDEQAANLLTSDAVDPISAMPEFKTNVVRVARMQPSPASRKPESPHERTQDRPRRLRTGRRTLRRGTAARRASRRRRAHRRRAAKPSRRTTACWSRSTRSATPSSTR